MLARASHDLPPLAVPPRVGPGDLVCEEELVRKPGEGDHWWLRLRVAGLGLRQVVAAVARAGGVEEAVVGVAGPRDRRSTVLQWVSVPQELVEHPKRLRNAGYQKKLKVLEVREGRGPIAPASVAALRWRCRLPGCAAEEGFLRGRAILDRLRRGGCPNYLGGLDPKQIKWGRLVAQGKPLPPRVRSAGAEPRRCLLAFRAALFNRLVAARLEDGLLGGVVAGDRLEVHLNRPPARHEFLVAEHPEDAAAMQPRCDSWEAVVQLPLFGGGREPARGEALERERAVLDEAGVDEAGFADLVADWRAVRVQPTSAVLELEGADLSLSCRLPPEAHIRSLLDEFGGGEGGADG